MNIEHLDKEKFLLEHFNFSSGIVMENMSHEDKEWLNLNAKVRRLKKKEVLFEQGDYPRGVYFITKGKLKAYKLNDTGKTQILFIFSKGEMFGHRPLLGEESHPLSVQALESTELLFIERERFLEHVRHSEQFSKQLLTGLCHGFTVYTNLLNLYSQQSVTKRLALILLILKDKYERGSEPGESTHIELTRTDLANYVGTSLENLVRTLKDFQEKKLIDCKKRAIIINNVERLLKLLPFNVTVNIILGVEL